MTLLHQNADCRVQDARGSVGLVAGVPTWLLTTATVWCQKSDAGRGGNPDRRQSRDGISASTSDTGAKVIRPAAGRKPVLLSHFGASASRGLYRTPMPRTVGAANSPRGPSPKGPVPPEHKCKPAVATWVSGTLSSTPSISCGGFIPGLSARVVVWFIGVEVSFSVVVPSDVAAATLGVRAATTDAPGVGGLADAGRLLCRGPAASGGSGACKSRNTEAASVSGGENPSTPANFPGSRPGLKGTTWPKNRINERSRKYRECRQPQPSLCNLESPSPTMSGPAPRSTRGRLWVTAIRSSSPESRRSRSRRPLPLPGSVTVSGAALPMPKRVASRVVGCGGWRVGESTRLPRLEAWGALSGHMVRRSLGLCRKDRQGRSVTRLPALLKNKTDVGQVWTGAPTVELGNQGADAIESRSGNQGSRSERNASDVADAYRVRTGLNVPMKDTALS